MQLGGAHLDQDGMRAVPSLRYTLDRTPIWFHERSVSEAENLIDNEPPAGGFADDGRFDRLRDQARFPLLASNEMANVDARAVVAKLRSGPSATQFRGVFGSAILEDANAALSKAVFAIERFELTDPSFHPYTSKYDAYLDGLAKLTPHEARGKKLFDDPQKAGCELCHLDTKGANGAHPIFTDFQFEALGVPRNTALRANGNARYADLGLCGPARTDQARVAAFCGLFKTPTLRNVATREVFFHNGKFHTLRDALRFYVERDTNPEKWYPVDADGKLVKYDDLPQRYRANVDIADPPLTAKRGDRPVWNDRDIDDVIAFLKTLDDGYSKTPHDGGIKI